MFIFSGERRREWNFVSKQEFLEISLILERKNFIVLVVPDRRTTDVELVYFTND